MKRSGPPNAVCATLKALQTGWGSAGGAALDDFLRMWSQCFEATVQGKSVDAHSVRFNMEISTIRLNGMGIMPFLLVAGAGDQSRAAIQGFRKGFWFGRILPVVMCATDAAYVAARDILTGSRGLVLSSAVIAEVIADDDPVSAFRKQVVRHVPFKRLIPFSFTQPAEGNMFFGRDHELDMLLHEAGMDYVISSGGQMGMGKTSLARQVRHVLRQELDPRYARMVFVDLYTSKPDTDSVLREIAHGIRHTSFSHELGIDDLLAFLRRERKSDPRFAEGSIELYVDEADAALAWDRRRGYPLLKVLKQAREADLVRVLFLGRDEPEQVFRDKANPLNGRMKSITLGALDREEARDLLLVPLRHLGVELTDPEGVTQLVLDSSQSHPLKIQTWGFEIANRAAVNADRSFTVDDLKAVEKLVA